MAFAIPLTIIFCSLLSIMNNLYKHMLHLNNIPFLSVIFTIILQSCGLIVSPLEEVWRFSSILFHQVMVLSLSERTIKCIIPPIHQESHNNREDHSRFTGRHAPKLYAYH